MQVTRRNFLKAGGISALGLGMSGWLGVAGAQAVYAQSADPVIHLLNRTTWGVRPQDVTRVQQIGATAWIEEQLAYESIPDPVVDAFITQRRVLQLDIDALAEFASNNYGAAFDALMWSRIHRAANSERQLYELMVEFWTDHFNIPAPDYLDIKMIDDRDVIRQYALGNFRDLLFASATSPAMLLYLDQAVSEKEHPNENYAREVMELHTLGVDGGYSEDDAAALARALTGWTLTDNNHHFRYDPEMHDSNAKTLLGVTFPAGRGVEDGLEAIDLLARHPSTARFIATKLVRRFVSDQPPATLVDSAAQKFLETSGDIREVLRHILNSDEFRAAAGQKFRRPLEYTIALLRVLSPALQVNSINRIYSYLETMGHLPFHWFPPNGYPDAAGAWLNTNGLLHRWNLALELALSGEGAFDGTSMNIDVVIGEVSTVGEMVDAVTDRVLHITLPETERRMLIEFVSRRGDETQPVDADLRYNRLPSLLGLVMASPYFQWH